MLKRIGRLSLRAAHNPRRAAEALLWWLLGRKKRARQLFLPYQTKLDRRHYAIWIKKYDILNNSDRNAMRRTLTDWPSPPLISIIMPVHDPPLKFLREAVDSVRGQIYLNWELCIADDASTKPEIITFLEQLAREDSRVKVLFRSENGHISRATNSALELASGEFVAMMDHDDRMAENALFEIAKLLQLNPKAEIIYSDEDQIDENGQRFRPHFKTDWNKELFLSINYINHLAVLRTSLVRLVGGYRSGLEGSQDHDLILRLLKHTQEQRIHHIPKVLYHWRNFETHGSMSMCHPHVAVAARQRALAEYLHDAEPSAEVAPGPGGFNRVIRPLPEPPPMVTLIVPTRDQLNLLRTCVSGLLEGTDYPNLEVIIVDNDSKEPRTLAYLESLSDDTRVRIVECPGPFNFSAINNHAVSLSRGEYIGLINNDVEVIDAGWLREMVSHAMLPEVGAVGCRLLYSDGRIQHAGVILGIGGVADHSHKFFDCAASGYFYRPQLQQYVSAVTAACLVVSKKKFNAIGGLNDKDLTIAFNDVDFCLRLNDAGWKNIYTPYATLYHHESMSRGRDARGVKAVRHAEEIKYMITRWGERLQNDPYYNPNLSLGGESFTLRE